MQTTFLLKTEITIPSGNHGRENNNTIAMPVDSAEMRAPVQSKQSFAIPNSVVKSPSIKELVKDPPPVVTPEVAPAQASSFSQPTTPTQENITTHPDNENITQTSETASPIPNQKIVNSTENHQTTSLLQQVVDNQPTIEINPSPMETELKPSAAIPNVESIQNIETLPESVKDSPDAQTSPTTVEDSSSETNESFTIELLMQHWTPMVQTVFSQTPTLYSSLLHYLPTVDNNTIHIVLRNERQETDFRSKKHEVLAYLRTNCSPTIEDVILTIDINMETKKIILDDNDKLDELCRQNPDITDFIKILNLRLQR